MEATPWPWKAQVDEVVEKIKAKSAQMREAKGSAAGDQPNAAWLQELLLLKHEVRRALGPPRALCPPRIPSACR